MKIKIFFPILTAVLIGCSLLSAEQLKPEQKQLVVYQPAQSLNTQQFGQLVSLLNQPRYQEVFQHLMTQQLESLKRAQIKQIEAQQRKDEVTDLKDMFKEIRDAAKPKKETTPETVLKETGSFIKDIAKGTFGWVRSYVVAIVPAIAGTTICALITWCLLKQLPGFDDYVLQPLWTACSDDSTKPFLRVLFENLLKKKPTAPVA